MRAVGDIGYSITEKIIFESPQPPFSKGGVVKKSWRISPLSWFGRQMAMSAGSIGGRNR